MKNIYIILTVFALSLVSCNSLDLYPLDQGSSETWYSNETEYEMAVNDLYRTAFWPVAKEAWSDDYLYRDVAGPDIVDGTLNSETNTSGSVELATFYTNQYKAIAVPMLSLLIWIVVVKMGSMRQLCCPMKPRHVFHVLHIMPCWSLLLVM